MKLTGNTIFITGGGSGIGRGLAEAFHKLGNKVIISGRRRANLDEVAAVNPGMEAVELDVADPTSILAVAAKVIADHPGLNVLINNAGIMLPDRAAGLIVDKLLVDTVTTNLVGPIRMTSALIEHLKGKDDSVIAYTSSALGFVPMALTAVYSATKAALHSYVLSQRFLLKDAGVRVLEIAPPWVRTDLMNSREAELAMPLECESAPRRDPVAFNNINALGCRSASRPHAEQHLSADASFGTDVELASRATIQRLGTHFFNDGLARSNGWQRRSWHTKWRRSSIHPSHTDADAVQLVMRIGQLRPLCRTAVGKVLLAQHSDKKIAAIVQRINSRADGAERILIKKLMPELAEIRRDGIAYSVNAASPGAAVIAALVPASEQDLPMAIGVGGPVDHIVLHRDMIVDALRRALQLA